MMILQEIPVSQMASLRIRSRLVACILLLGPPLSASCECGTTSEGGTPAAPSAISSGAATAGAAARSCQGLAATCGPSGNDDCCRSLPVPGGTFDRDYDGVDFLDRSYPATVSDFYLDKYEVTVGRFRAFVDAGMGTQENPPAEGTGAHPRIRGSGWRSAWNAKLPSNTAALRAGLKCHPHYQSWTDVAGSNENKPVNCPWSSPANSTTIDDSYAVYCGNTCKLLSVGSKSPKGDGKWGQSDLGGNVWEWTLDFAAGAYPMPCHDCAAVTKGYYRAFRSGSNDDIAATLRASVRHVYYPEYRGVVGSRCARDP
jgi:sulfatase modifying factor 1